MTMRHLLRLRTCELKQGLSSASGEVCVPRSGARPTYSGEAEPARAPGGLTRRFTAVLAFSVAIVAGAHLVATERATEGSVPGFSLLPPSNCDLTPDARRCRVSGPKEWSGTERDFIRQTLRRLAVQDLVQGLLVGAHENGFSGLRRYANDTQQDPALGPVPAFNPGFVFYSAKEIGITDAFFATEGVRDPISDYLFGDLVLIHELVHAFDNRKGSTEHGFTTMTGWALRDNRWEYVNRVSYSAYLGVYADTLTLYATGRYGEARTRDRSFATSLSFPMPTIQSLASPDESFADILAHLIVDPRAATYLKPRVVEWFEANVFPALREKAAQFKPVDYDLE